MKRWRWCAIAALAWLWRRVPVRGPGRLVSALASESTIEGEDGQVTIGDISVAVSFANPPETELFLWRRYEPEVEAVIDAALPPAGVAIDIGANCGVLSLRMARAAGASGRVVAVDPSAAACRRIRRQASRNGFAHVTAVEVALNAEEGTEQYAAGRIGIGSLPAGDTQLVLGAARPVRHRTLDGLVAELAVDELHLVKIDTDGAEAHVLRGGRATLARMRPVVVFEVFERGLRRRGVDSSALHAELDTAGYELWRPVWQSRPRFCVGPRRLVRFERTIGPALPDGNLLALHPEVEHHRSAIRILSGCIMRSVWLRPPHRPSAPQTTASTPPERSAQ